MPRVKRVVECLRCGREFHPWNGPNRRFCSRRCNCLARQTREHQVKAGKAGDATNIKLRGTGNKGYIKYFGRHEHRVIAEQTLGRKLGPREIVHHIDKNPHNNTPGNLMVITQSLHIKLHKEDLFKK